MSVPAMLEWLARRLLGTDETPTLSNARNQLKNTFVEDVIHGKWSNGQASAGSHDIEEQILTISGLALGWKMAGRRDHATALNILMQRFMQCSSIKLPVFHYSAKQSLHLHQLGREIPLTEQSGVFRLLLRLHALNHPNADQQPLQFNSNAHSLTKYAEELLQSTEQGQESERNDIGWFIASSTTSYRHSRVQSHLSVNDTSFDTIWSELLAPDSAKAPNQPSLRHSIFSTTSTPAVVDTPVRTDIKPTSPSKASASHTAMHRLEGLGSLFGVLRFAHPSIIPPAVFEELNTGNSEFNTPIMRMDLAGDAIGRLELPGLGESGSDPFWIDLQNWKPSVSDTKDSSTSQNEIDTRPSTETIEVVQRRVSVLDWIERTWNGAAGPLPPWHIDFHRSSSGMPVETEALQWKDRLVDRAQLLNETTESVGELLREFLERIVTLHQDSILTSHAFCNGVRKFIHHWRGELLFASKEAKLRESIPTATTPLDQILPPIDWSLIGLDPSEDDFLAGMVMEDSEEKQDFKSSFERVVSASGSYIQIVFLHHLVNNIIGNPDDAQLLPIGSDLINRLLGHCSAFEMDPTITKGISQHLLSLVLVPTAKYLSEWLFWGMLPPHQEFMIEHSPPSTSPTEPASWLSGFRVKRSHVPYFLHHHEEMVLKTGVLVQIYRQLSKSRFTSSRWSEAPRLRVATSTVELDQYYKQLEDYISSADATEETTEKRACLHGTLEDIGDRMRGSLDSLTEMSSDRIVSVEQSLYDSFVIPIEMQYKWVSTNVCKLVIGDLGVKTCIERLKTDFFGNLVSSSFEALPTGVELLDASASSQTLERLRVIFAENIEESLEKMEYRLALEKIPVCSGIDVLDNIAIEPRYIHWPLSTIITPGHVQQYNSVMVLLLKMTRTRAALNSIWTNLSHATRLAHRQHSLQKQKQRTRHVANYGSSSSDSVQADSPLNDSIFEIDFASVFAALHKASTFCHQLQHFWTQMYSYIVNQVAHTCFHQLSSDINAAVHFEDIVSAHQTYVNQITKCALLSQNSRAVMVVIEKTIHLVHKFREQIRFSLADPSKWELKSRQKPAALRRNNLGGDLDASLAMSIFGGSSKAGVDGAGDGAIIPDDLDSSIFEQENYQSDVLEQLVSSTRADFSKCMKFLLAVLLKLLSRGYEPHMAALVASLNWNQFYHSGTEVLAQSI